jgi:hypothetical protein
MNRSL